MDLETYYRDMLTCEAFAHNARTILIPLLRGSNCTLQDLTGFSFQIVLPTNGFVKAISFSIPPDINKGISNGNDSPIFETALIGFENNNIIYNKGLLYDDVKRFDSLQDVADDVKRIIRTVQ